MDANNVNLLVDVDLFDRAQTSPQQHKPAVSDLLLLDWGEFRSAGATSVAHAHQNHAKTLSCSEYTSDSEKPFTAEDIIRLSAGSFKQRSHSHPASTDAVLETNSDRLLDFSVFEDAPKVTNVPPQIPKLAVPPALEQKRRDRNCLNGYIRHDPIPALIEVETEAGEITQHGFVSSKTEDTYGNGRVQRASDETGQNRQICTNSEEDSDQDSDDEVFHASARWSSRSENEVFLRQPLMPRHSKKHHHAKAGFVENGNLLGNEDADDLGLGARVRKGRSWKSRFMCLTYFLLVNLLLGGLVTAVVLFTDRFWQKLVNPPEIVEVYSDLCPELAWNYLANYTTEREGIYVQGYQRIIKRKGGKGWLLLIPYRSFCFEDVGCPPGGVLAVYSDTLQQAWDYRPSSNGPVASLTCYPDINGDGVEDCAVVLDDDTLVEILSGADGTQITKWYPKDPGWRAFAPVQIPDLNGDSVPEFLVTLTKSTRFGKAQDTVFRMWLSKSNPKVPAHVHFPESKNILTVNNLTASSPARLWNLGEAEPEVITKYDQQSGLYMWKFSSIVRQKFEDVLQVFLDRQWGQGDGSFADLNADGAEELVICDSAGDLVALDLFARKELWKWHQDRFTCLGPSIGFVRAEDEARTDVFVLLKSTEGNSEKIVVVNGKTGEGSRSVDLNGLPNSIIPVPLATLAKKGVHSAGFLVFWRVVDSNTLQLVASGGSKNTSVLYETELLTPADPNDMESVSLSEILNERYTGAFHSRNGSLELFFVENLLDEDGETWRILIHKMNLSCQCWTRNCGKFDNVQPWSAYQGTLGNNLFNLPK